MSTRPTTVIDPVCGMTVDVAAADADGRTAVHDGRTYAFCRSGCLRAFNEEPHVYAARAEAAAATEQAPHDHADDPGHAHLAGASPAGGRASAASTLAAVPPPMVIDEGMRRWYESCSCCLSDAYPEIKAALDAERAAAAAPPAGPGICEVAEAAMDAAEVSAPA